MNYANGLIYLFVLPYFHVFICSFNITLYNYKNMSIHPKANCTKQRIVTLIHMLCPVLSLYMYTW